MQVKKQQLEPDMGQWTGSKLGKEYVKAVYCHPAYLTYRQSTHVQSMNLPILVAYVNGIISYLFFVLVPEKLLFLLY